MSRKTLRLCSIIMAVVFIVTLTTAGAGRGNSKAPVPLVTVTVASQAMAQALVNSGLDVAAVYEVDGGYAVDIVLAPYERGYLKSMGFSWDVKVANLLTPADAGGDFSIMAPTRTTYRNLTDYNNEMSQIASSYPSLARRRQIGTSIEGRAIYALEISSPVTTYDGRAEVLFTGLHHAREWQSGEYTIMLAWDLVEKYASNSTVRTILDNTRIWLVPVVNPDGFNYSRTTYAMWRKNRRNNGNGTYGVDLNRNYSYWWGGTGSSGTTSSDTYRGTAPFSEPETRAIRDLMLSKHFITALNSHSYSRLVLYPWGYTTSYAPERTLLKTISDQMASYTGGYTSKQASSLYVCSGTTDDWSYGSQANLGYTFEDNTAFQPAYSTAMAQYPKNYGAYIYLMQQGPTRASTLTGTIKNTAGQNITATLTLSRTLQVPRSNGTLVTENFSSSLTRTGSYNWKITPSKMPRESTDPGYTLTVTASGYRTATYNVKPTRGSTQTLNIVLQPN